MQNDATRPASLRKEPYLITRSLHGFGAAVIQIRLHLIDAIDDADRMQSLVHTVSLSLSPDQCTSSQNSYSFTTQAVTYDVEAASPSRSSPEQGSAIEPAAKRSRLNTLKCQ